MHCDSSFCITSDNIHLLDSPSLTFDLLCRSRLMLDEAKLSPTSASICTTNRMLGEAQSNKCFIMPKSLNDNIKTESCSDDKHFQININLWCIIVNFLRQTKARVYSFEPIPFSIAFSSWNVYSFNPLF